MGDGVDHAAKHIGSVVEGEAKKLGAVVEDVGDSFLKECEGMPLILKSLKQGAEQKLKNWRRDAAWGVRGADWALHNRSEARWALHNRSELLWAKNNPGLAATDGTADAEEKFSHLSRREQLKVMNEGRKVMKDVKRDMDM